MLRQDPGLENCYRVVPYLEVDTPAAQAAELSRLAFADYPGVLQPSLAHTTWYLGRPGTDRSLSRAVLHGDRLVGSAFVCVAPVRLGGSLHTVGIVDTVMVHPVHRRRGLARWMLGDAVSAMRARGLEASLLYTVAGSAPSRLYESLGYRAHTAVSAYRRVQDRERRAANVRRATPADEAAVMDLLNTHWGEADGYVPLDAPLWRWRKLVRPPELPAEVWLVTEGDIASTDAPLLGCVTLCPAPIVDGNGGAAPRHDVSYVLTDLALSPGARSEAILEALLSAVPAYEETVILSAFTDVLVNRLLSSMGFDQEPGEVAMVLPLDWRLEASLYGSARRWYVLAESVIGV